MLPAMLAAGFLTAMSEAQVVNVPTPVATSSGFQGFINTTTYFATLIRDTSYVGNNPGPIVIYSWNRPRIKQRSPRFRRTLHTIQTFVRESLRSCPIRK
jgi:hypothetical protein